MRIPPSRGEERGDEGGDDGDGDLYHDSRRVNPHFVNLHIQEVGEETLQPQSGRSTDGNGNQSRQHTVHQHQEQVTPHNLPRAGANRFHYPDLAHLLRDDGADAVIDEEDAQDDDDTT